MYVDPNTGKIKVETNMPVNAGSAGVDFGAANGVGSLSGLKNPAPIAPGLGMVNSNTNSGKSAWETAKDKTSQGVADATKQEYISYLDQQSQKPTGGGAGEELRAPGLSMNSPTDKSVWEQSKDQASQIVADATGKDDVSYIDRVTTGTAPITPPKKETPVQPVLPPIIVQQGGSPNVLQDVPKVVYPDVPPVVYPDMPDYGIGGGGAGSENTPSGGGSTIERVVLPTVKDQSDYINEYYAMAEERAKNAAEEAYLKALETIDAEAAKIPSYYYEAGRQQTGQNALERKAMNERFAASGLNTGAAGQAALAQSAVNQNAMAQIRQAEADAMAAVESRRREVAIEYEAKVRDAVLSGDMAKAQALFAEAQRVDESIVNVAMQQAQLDFQYLQQQAQQDYQRQQMEMQAQNWAYENAYQKAQDEEARREAKAKMLASVGDFSGYKALGWTDDEIAVLKGYWDAQNAKPTYGNSGGSLAAGNIGGISGNSVNTPLKGAQAQSLYGAVSKGLMDAASAGYILDAGLANGTISEAEAEYIMAAMGY